MTEEENNTINFLDLTIIRKHKKLEINIYRKPTTTDNTIHYKSNHPIEHKLAAYRYLLNRLHNLPLSKEDKHQEMNTILQIAKNNEYPERLINKLNTKIKTTTSIHNIPKIKINNKKWAIFEYSNPVIRKETNIFKNTDVKITSDRATSPKTFTEHPKKSIILTVTVEYIAYSVTHVKDIMLARLAEI